MWSIIEYTLYWGVMGTSVIYVESYSNLVNKSIIRSKIMDSIIQIYFTCVNQTISQ